MPAPFSEQCMNLAARIRSHWHGLTCRRCPPVVVVRAPSAGRPTSMEGRRSVVFGCRPPRPQASPAVRYSVRYSNPANSPDTSVRPGQSPGPEQPNRTVVDALDELRRSLKVKPSSMLAEHHSERLALNTRARALRRSGRNLPRPRHRDRRTILRRRRPNHLPRPTRPRPDRGGKGTEVRNGPLGVRSVIHPGPAPQLDIIFENRGTIRVPTDLLTKPIRGRQVTGIITHPYCLTTQPPKATPTPPPDSSPQTQRHAKASTSASPAAGTTPASTSSPTKPSTPTAATSTITSPHPPRQRPHRRHRTSTRRRHSRQPGHRPRHRPRPRPRMVNQSGELMRRPTLDSTVADLA